MERSKLNSGITRISFGVLLALGTSFLSAQAFAGSTLSTALPLWFILVLFAVAWWYGFAAGFLGSLVCAFVFAHFLFDPTGSWHVQSEVARRNLLWMVLGAVAMSHFLAPHRSEGDPD